MSEAHGHIRPDSEMFYEAVNILRYQVKSRGGDPDYETRLDGCYATQILSLCRALNRN